MRLLPSVCCVRCAVCSCRAVMITVPTPEVNTSERFAPVITTDLTPRHSWAPQGRVFVVLKTQAVVCLESLEGSSQVTLEVFSFLLCDWGVNGDCLWDSGSLWDLVCADSVVLIVSVDDPRCPLRCRTFGCWLDGVGRRPKSGCLGVFWRSEYNCTSCPQFALPTASAYLPSLSPECLGVHVSLFCFLGSWLRCITKMVGEGDWRESLASAARAVIDAAKIARDGAAGLGAGATGDCWRGDCSTDGVLCYSSFAQT